MTREILIIGGGVIGLAVARALHKKGARHITIIERGETGRESSAAAAGMLAAAAETSAAGTFAEFCTESLDLYEDFAAELLAETGVDIELDKNGTLYAAFSEAGAAELRRRFDWQTKAGLNVELLKAEDVRRVEPFISPDVREALFFPRDWQVENRRLLDALRRYADAHAVEICEQTKVERVIVENGKAVGARTAAGDFYAGAVILTTGAWTSGIEADGLSLPPVKPIRGQIIVFQTAKRLFEKVIYSSRGYLVPRADGRILIGATVEDVGFDDVVTEAGTDFLRQVALEISPSLVNLPISESRSGLRPLAPDGLPVIGGFPQVENLFSATAHYRNGILLAPLTAQIVAENIIENRESPYLTAFAPNRFERELTAKIEK